MERYKALLVAAIDIGTAYSGYSFSFRHQFDSNPLNVSVSTWVRPDSGISSKTSTTVLLDKNKNFHSFGYEAEDYYSKLVEEGKHAAWYYFHRFERILYDKEREVDLPTRVMLKDIREREISALTVFSEAIRYLKGHLLKAKGMVPFEDIEWVLSVPAIWSDPAKEFIRLAAGMAGITLDQLTIVLEPEAVSLYCKYLPLKKQSRSEQDFICFSKGSKYLVLDAGEDRTDVTVLEMQSDGSSRVLHTACDWSQGRKKAVQGFHEMLTRIVGKDVMDEFMTNEMDDYNYIMQEFFNKLCVADPALNKRIVMRFPMSFSDTLTTKTGLDMKDAIDKANMNGIIQHRTGKIVMDLIAFREICADALDSVTLLVLDVLTHLSCSKTDIIIMTGEFSRSRLLQDSVKSVFSNMRVITPPNPEIAALVGSVIFAHTPLAIRSEWAYGLCTNRLFDPKYDPQNRKIYRENDQTFYCRNSFSKQAPKGEILGIKMAHSDQLYNPLHTQQRSITFPVYISDINNPRFVDEPNCCEIGKLSINLPDVKDDDHRAVRILFMFEINLIKIVTIDTATKAFSEHTLPYPSHWQNLEAKFETTDSVSKASGDALVTRRGKYPPYRHRE